jgi:lipid A 3-O-deacylase PagL
VDALKLPPLTAPRARTCTRAVLSLLVLLVIPPNGSAQSLDNPWFVRTGATSAFIFGANPYANANHPGGPIDSGRDLTFEIGRQTDGSEEWHQLYGMPSFGFGFSLGSFRNDAVHARPTEAYTFFSWPFARFTDRLDMATEFGMGMSWHWKEVTGNAENETSLGSDLNARINWGFFLRYLTTSQITLFTGVDYTHRSNGGMVQPDRGINVIGPRVILQYNFAPTSMSRVVTTPPPFHPSWEFVAGGTGGVKNVIERKDPLARSNFGSFDATTGLQRQFYQYGKIAVGADLAYDGAAGVSIDANDVRWRADPGQRWGLGFYSGYEHVIGRFGALVQVGEQVARGLRDEDAPRLYERFGWRYHLNDRYWTTIVIRAVDGWRADALQFGFGYRTRLFEK